MNIRCLDGDDKLFRDAAHRRGGVAAALVALLASAITFAYLADAVGLQIAPFPILILSLAVAAIAFAALRRQAARDGAALCGFSVSVLGTFAWFLWLARPDFLPTGSGPDLAHHLSLLEYIQRHWRLVHDVALSEYLGEMVDYTPGSHLLAVLTGAWVRSDALHAVYPTVAATVALKAGLVFLIALRLLPRDVPRVAGATLAVILLFLARVHFVGSFTEQSYLAQVVSELFAVAMWWALIVWDEHPSPGPMAFFALWGVAAFLSWPVWIGPLLVVLAALALLHGELPLVKRLQQLAIRGSPIALIAAIHGSRHVGGFRMAGTGGFAIWPTPGLLGWWFIGLAAAGLLYCVAARQARTLTLLLASTAVQAAALFGTAHSSGAAAPYLSLKMFYLAVYPLMVGAALMIASGMHAVSRTLRLPGKARVAARLGAGGSGGDRGRQAAGRGAAAAPDRLAAGARCRRVGTRPDAARLHRLSGGRRLHRVLAAPCGVRPAARVGPRDGRRHLRREEGDRQVDSAQRPAARRRRRLRRAAARHPLQRRCPRALRARRRRQAARTVSVLEVNLLEREPFRRALSLG
jgi:hypothetical protein